MKGISDDTPRKIITNAQKKLSQKALIKMPSYRGESKAYWKAAFLYW